MGRDYYAKNKERCKITSARYYAKNKVRMRAANATWCKANKTKRKLSAARSYRANKIKYKEWSRAWEKQNPQATREIQRRCEKKQRENLLRPYVVRLIRRRTGLPSSLIPKALTDAKIMQIKLYRLIKDIRNENTR